MRSGGQILTGLELQLSTTTSIWQRHCLPLLQPGCDVMPGGVAVRPSGYLGSLSKGANWEHSTMA